MAFIGYAYRNLGNDNEALRYHHWGHQIYKEQKNEKQVFRMLNKLAVMHQELGNADSARFYYELNISQLEGTDRQSDLAQTYGNLSTLYGREGNNIKAIEYVLKAIKIRESINDWKNLSTNYMNLGYLFQGQEELEEALKYFAKAEEINAKTTDDRRLQEAVILLNIGFVKMKQNKLEEALPIIRKSLDLRVKAPDQQGIGFSANNMGKIMELMGEPDSALYYFKWAEKQWRLLNYKQGLVATLHNIGMLELKNNNVSEALNIGLESYNIAEEINFPDRKRDAAELLMSVYEKKGDWRKAYEMQSVVRVLSDSLKNESIRKSALRESLQYQFDMEAAADSIQREEEKKQDALKLKAQKAETENQRIEANYQKKQNTLLYVGVVLLVLLAGFIFQRFRVSQKQKSIIESQKKEVEVQKNEAQLQKELVEEKNKEILNSINYAKRIQGAILPSDKLVTSHLENSFILYKPKDIVAGDFYWMEPFKGKKQNENGVLFAAADCTGHGVPGAMVSVVCNNALNRSVREFGLVEPGEILDKTREIVISEFEKSEEDVKDGMDIALCSLTFTQKVKQSESGSLTPTASETQTRTDFSHAALLKYAGAHNPIWIVRKGQIVPADLGLNNAGITTLVEIDDYSLLEVKGNKQPIGQFEALAQFDTHTIKLQKDDAVYIFSDGYADQFGGKKGKKLKASNMKKLILSIQTKDINSQKAALDNALEEWMGEFEQLDDICVIGVRV